MRDTVEYLEVELKQCKMLAARAANKADKQFWLTLAHRWEELLRARQRSCPDMAMSGSASDREHRPSSLLRHEIASAVLAIGTVGVGAWLVHLFL
jgi:hypothetical protein